MSSSVHSDVILLFTREEQKLMSAQIMYACAGLTGDVSSRRHRLPVLTLTDVFLTHKNVSLRQTRPTI